MKKILFVSTFFVLLSLVFIGCARPQEGDAQFVRIGNRVFTLADLTAFSSIIYNHPVRTMEERFPGNRTLTTLFVETQVLYPQARGFRRQVTSAADWRWREKFLTGHFFQLSIIDRNMGASDEEILAYWRRNRSALAAEWALDESDTILDIQARVQVVQRLFLNRFPPSQEFVVGSTGMTRREIENTWFENAVNDREAFFRNQFFLRRYGREFPTYNLRAELVGSVISDADIRAVMTWISDAANVSEDFVISKMVSWTLFAEEARRSGFTRDENFRRSREQFERFELVRFYVNEVLTQNVAANFVPNAEIIRFAIADRNRRASLNVSRDELTRFSDSLRTIMHEANIIGHIHEQRARTRVQFLQADFVDMFAQTSAQLKYEAGNLAMSHNIERARRIYRDLTQWFLYSSDGVSSFLEMARLQVDMRDYAGAIESYRNYLLFSNEDSEWCRVFFMIAYIYAEYLQNLPLAALNYRWILQNQADCVLAQDAEFMFLNLGEPMADIEELRLMSIRQGRE